MPLGYLLYLCNRLLPYVQAILHVLEGLVQNLSLKGPELQCRHLVLKQLVDLFEGASLELGNKEVVPCQCDDTCAGPDVPVFSSLDRHRQSNEPKLPKWRWNTYPVEVLGVDKVWRAERHKPNDELSDSLRQAK